MHQVFVGVTDYAQGELGDVVFAEIETEGEELDDLMSAEEYDKMVNT